MWRVSRCDVHSELAHSSHKLEQQIFNSNSHRCIVHDLPVRLHWDHSGAIFIEKPSVVLKKLVLQASPTSLLCQRIEPPSEQNLVCRRDDDATQYDGWPDEKKNE